VNVKHLLLFLPLLLLGVACDNTPAPEPRDCVDVVPADNEISGWTKVSALQVAETNTQLEALIDGEAVPYEANGFKKCAFQNYSGTVNGSPVELDLRVFDQTDTTGAKNVFPAVATGTEVPWTGDNPGREARTDESGLFSYRVDFRSDKFYVSLTIMDKSTQAMDVAKLFALNIDAAVKDAAN
jgi:hypothetical protein